MTRSRVLIPATAVNVVVSPFEGRSFLLSFAVARPTLTPGVMLATLTVTFDPVAVMKSHLLLGSDCNEHAMASPNLQRWPTSRAFQRFIEARAIVSLEPELQTVMLDSDGHLRNVSGFYEIEATTRERPNEVALATAKDLKTRTGAGP